jgi:hypothetical protein
MPRRFTDATALFADLLDRHETGTENPIAYPDYVSFASVVAADNFIKDLRRAEETGAVRIATGSGRRRDQVTHVRLVAPAALYRFLARTPIADIAVDAQARLTDGLTLHPGLLDAVSGIVAAWSRAKSWSAFGPQDVDKLRDAVILAQAILEQRHVGMDYRTFSRRIAGESKTLERVEGAVTRLLGSLLDLPPGAKPREALRTLGLEKFAPPLLISGRVDLANADLSRASPLYFGIAPNEADRIRFREPPAYLLTIENFASFSRHVIEADPHRVGTTLYVGGYPSLATQQALRTLAPMLANSTPMFHWSDIDPDGTWIFRTVEKAVGRAVRPHLMSVDIAERLGRAPASRLVPTSCPPESGIHPVSEYLEREDAKTLEQEELDPSMPV